MCLFAVRSIELSNLVLAKLIKMDKLMIVICIID
jgi:hypothetical protein